MHVSWMGSIKTEKIAIFAVILINITLLLLSQVLSITFISINMKLYDQIMHKMYIFQKGLHTFSCHCIIRRRFIPCKNLKNYGIRSKGNTRYWIFYISKKLALENVTILHWIFTLVFTFNLHFIEFTLVVISNELVQCFMLTNMIFRRKK